ncbi:MAG: hypothetical protein DRP42_04820 [Tenericutes bacterium]|nr:MAG: hypothetical protein DRP42_04820 [Mycoplasmatota bacterium]
MRKQFWQDASDECLHQVYDDRCVHCGAEMRLVELAEGEIVVDEANMREIFFISKVGEMNPVDTVTRLGMVQEEME